ncbi:cyclase [Arthrobacter sp. MYb211]|uniref:cyclase family protein n=1 Tax=Micrococcaceae TaxID=1268 RepID=UPI000CFC9DE9|nr:MULTISPECIES: cyclase family protein [unclassified Arthrobacter]PQZ96542.1 cyclase [Arthrobacter sp. MYb224]PRA02015.1 cyclase [Arthrobacter sp. MYb229]PRA13117.1 cyclase [Arthrobacter sp. MYb221]PRB50735.1 cyclase [Arthrobacter sp. MYb216]PRC10310.1 cyclase [Arthrobacter sp. MYb211]
MTQLAHVLSSLASGTVTVHDLTAPLSVNTPTLVLPEPFSNLIDFSIEEVSAYDEPGPFWKHHNIHTGEHIGTHIDAPIHWISGRDGKDVSQIDPQRLVGPAVVLDFSAETAESPDYLITVDDLKAWQAQHGEFPPNSWLLFRTGWDQYGEDSAAFLNTDEQGSHTPGFTAECAQYIAQELVISGVGVETVGIDAGNAALLDPPFPMHNFLLGHDKYGITSLKNLDKLPVFGALLVVAPLPIVGGTGAPARVLALS